jgi:type II secretory pathway pseudopilin PulG
MLRRALYLCGLAAVALALASCGSSGASQDELNEARTEGAKEAQQQAKIEKIEGQLKSLKHGHGVPNRSNTPGSSAPTDGSGNCGGSLSVGANTTCPFAENVEYEYYAEIGSGSGTVTAYSPVTEKLYSMYCTAGEPHECTGGNNATVYFP